MTMLLLRDSVSMKWVRPGWVRDPKTSVLNKWNQMHDVQNVFITDGSSYGFIGLPESIVDLYGIDSACSRLCCQRTEEREVIYRDKWPATQG